MRVAAGRQHGLAVTASGKVYSWGHGGALLGRAGDRFAVEAVNSDFDGLPATLVAAGEVRSSPHADLPCCPSPCIPRDR